jgi:hypothetical protein
MYVKYRFLYNYFSELLIQITMDICLDMCVSTQYLPFCKVWQHSNLPLLWQNANTPIKALQRCVLPPQMSTFSIK